MHVLLTVDQLPHDGGVIFPPALQDILYQLLSDLGCAQTTRCRSVPSTKELNLLPLHVDDRFTSKTPSLLQLTLLVSFFLQLGLLLSFLVQQLLALISQLLVGLYGLHEDDAPLLVCGIIIEGDADNFGVLVAFVFDFKVALSFFQSALPDDAISQVGYVARIYRVAILLILKDGVAYLGIPLNPRCFTFDDDLAFD